jgi:hypothetical protein
MCKKFVQEYDIIDTMPKRHGGSKLVRVRVCVYCMWIARVPRGHQQILCSRHIICIPRFHAVSPAFVTTLMKTTPRHSWVFTLERAPCALANPHSQLIDFLDWDQRGRCTCMWYRHFRLALDTRSYVHGRTYRRSHVCTARSLLPMVI